ncbi:MAG TPA: histidine phosphatase family protein [Cyclobacteriaceae bacterium]|nr:histidine phosphatase family protein [Cyclobacteriaceae bacterium]
MIIFAGDFNLSAHIFPDEMTKVLIVVRHAQSAGKQSGQRDYDRVLTPVGKKNSHELGEKIKKSSFQVDFILASAAVRAAQTVEHINKVLALPDEKIQFNTPLYEALIPGWIEIILELPDRFNTLMLVGHNPGISMLASALTGQNIDLAPCQMTGVELDLSSWKELTEGNQHTQQYFSL